MEQRNTVYRLPQPDTRTAVQHLVKRWPTADPPLQETMTNHEKLLGVMLRWRASHALMSELLGLEVGNKKWDEMRWDEMSPEVQTVI